MKPLKEVLRAVRVNNAEQSRANFRTALQKSVGTMHILQWDKETWGLFIELAEDAGVQTEMLSEELCISSNTVEAWKQNLAVPDESVRQAAIRYILAFVLDTAS